VDNAKEGYIPTRQKEINQMKGVEEEPEEMEMVSSEEEEEKKEDQPEVSKNVDEDFTDEEKEEAQDKLKKLKIKKYDKKLT
jgi:hypothetical protein